jgi:Protein of unknown function (DUF3348)
MRTSFNSSGLIRFLADLNIAESGESRQTFAERLSQWMGWTDAISLSTVLGAAPGGNASGNASGNVTQTATDAKANARAAKTGNTVGASGVCAAANATTEEFQRVRAELQRSITGDAAFSAQAGFERERTPWRQAYQARQRAMETRIGALRAEVRVALARQSQELARLAALDAVMERALGLRERQLLSTVPGLLERHAQRLHKEAGSDGNPAAALDSPQWQAVLLAELDIRLQPVEGMIVALDKQATGLK